LKIKINKSKKVFDRIKEIGRMSTYAARATFIKKIEDKLCGRFEIGVLEAIEK
jgi:hypothetical protein